MIPSWKHITYPIALSKPSIDIMNLTPNQGAGLLPGKSIGGEERKSEGVRTEAYGWKDAHRALDRIGKFEL